MTYQYDEWHVAKHSRLAGSDAYKRFLLEESSLPTWHHQTNVKIMICVRTEQTVNSLISVDLPAPLGPTIPIRLESNQ